MVVLSKQNVLHLHEKILKTTGGMAGVRDEGLLESAVMNCQQTFGGTDVYPHVIDKAAALAFALSKNHPFCDGNKRTSILAMLVMLKLNGFDSNHSQEQLSTLGLKLADGTLNHSQVREWICTHVRLV